LTVGARAEAKMIETNKMPMIYLIKYKNQAAKSTTTTLTRDKKEISILV